MPGRPTSVPFTCRPPGPAGAHLRAAAAAGELFFSALDVFGRTLNETYARRVCVCARRWGLVGRHAGMWVISERPRAALRPAGPPPLAEARDA